MHKQISIFLVLTLSSVFAEDGSGYDGSIYGGALALGGNGGSYGEVTGVPVQAAIATKRTYEVRPIMLQSEPAVPSVVDVQPSEQPVQVIFRTQSSPVMVQQVHTPSAPAQTEKTNSEDEPHRVVHEVVRPVIQEVREIIQPFRRVTQEVRPVLEEVHTVVAKGEKRQHNSHPYPPPPPHHVKHMMMGDDGPYGQMALGNEMVGSPVLAATQMAPNLATLATHGSAQYLPSPPRVHKSMYHRIAKLNKGKPRRSSKFIRNIANI